VLGVHEAGHALAAVAEGVEVQSLGLFLLGPLPGAFVHIDEAVRDLSAW